MKTLNFFQVIFEIMVAIGFAVGLFPLAYLIAMFWVIPLTIVNLVISIISWNKTFPFTITNVILAWLSLIPMAGYVFRILGIIVSAFSAVKAARKV